MTEQLEREAVAEGESATSDGSAERSRLSIWREIMLTSNPPEGEIDFVSRWLVLTRAAVQPMTITAAAVAGLIAVRAPGFNLVLLVLATVGVVLAHAANNLMNDLFDTETGLDRSADYPRALYAPHPVLSGMISRRGLLTAAAIVNVLDLAILVVLVAARGWPILVFALSGFFISYAYQAPPLRLKKIGLGEPSVFLVWGPLMVGGTYYAAAGTIGWKVFAASVPYGLLCTTVLMGKHIDKIPWDSAEGIHTIPVILGETRARAVTRGLMIAYFVSIAAVVAVRAVSVFALATLFAIPLLVKVFKVFGKPRPETPPERWPIWPLWFAAWAFVLTRRAGALFVLGLVAGVIAGF